MSSAEHHVTELLLAWGEGDEAAFEQLVPLVEAELRALARRYISNEAPGHTLQPTALVNEAYIKLINWRAASWENRAHFFAVAARIMRRILVNHAIRRQRLKHGGLSVFVPISQVEPVSKEQIVDVLALHEALLKLERLDERKSELVNLRFFGGLSEEETAEVLKRSLRTVQREWSLTRAWLFRELAGNESLPLQNL